MARWENRPHPNIHLCTNPQLIHMIWRMLLENLAHYTFAALVKYLNGDRLGWNSTNQLDRKMKANCWRGLGNHDSVGCYRNQSIFRAQPLTPFLWTQDCLSVKCETSHGESYVYNLKMCSYSVIIKPPYQSLDPQKTNFLTNTSIHMGTRRLFQPTSSWDRWKRLCWNASCRSPLQSGCVLFCN